MTQIVAAAAITPGDLVLEVGPGTGSLSECLLDAGARLLCVEIDSDLEPILQARIGDRATLLFTDVLASKHQLNPRVITALKSARPGSSFKLIANLPYNVASPLLANLVVDHPEMSLAVVMVQREVADRLAAPPGGKEFGPLGILVQAMCGVELLTTLSPSCFWPAPKVDSAVVRLIRRTQPLTHDPRKLSDLVHRLFQKRRKQIGSILGRSTPLPPGIDPQSRPEQLTLAQLAQLAVDL